MVSMAAKLERVKSVKSALPCDCDCHTGKCNHTSTPCHELYEYRETWQLTLPGQTFTFEHSYVYDNYKHHHEVFNFDIEKLLTQRGFKVFKYNTQSSDFYSYSERTSFVVKPIRNCYVIENVPHLISRAPWFSHTQSTSVYSHYLIIPPHANEAEWEVTEFGSSNVPHSYDILVEDPETGEKFVMLAQCWGHQEWWRTTRFYYKDGQLYEEDVASHWKCDGPCSYDYDEDEVDNS